VHRLFSTFARGWPAVGLLLLRFAAGAAIILDGIQRFQGGQATGAQFFALMGIGDGALLLAGLWTPIAGCVLIGVVGWEILVGHDHPYPGVLLCMMGAALTLVGPGALSLDAWLFGWKRIDV
jgi:uncharacterized membrane protein YphA (DoxX/SURF4 family)